MRYRGSTLWPVALTPLVVIGALLLNSCNPLFEGRSEAPQAQPALHYRAVPPPSGRRYWMRLEGRGAALARHMACAAMRQALPA